MKKKYIIALILIISLILPMFSPLQVEAKANTLKELRSDLNALIAKKNAADTAKKKTQTEINNAKNGITEAKNEIEVNNGKIEEAKDKVSSSWKSIEDKNTEMKEVITSYQLSEGSNVYIDFIFNASSITDLIYRYSVSEQLIDWQNDEISKYEVLISENEQLQSDLTEKEAELNKSIDKLATKVDSLGDKLEEYTEVSMDINDEIKSAKEYIAFVEKAGCGETEDIDICLGAVTDTGFRKPLVKGKITSLFGYRVIDLQVSSFHNAIDIGGNAEGTKVYAAAAGTVGKIIRKASCGGNSVYVWHTINGKRYTTQYTHLLSISVEVGDIVTSNTVVGLVGGGSTAKKNGGYDRCTTGAHLHFAMATGFYGGSGTNSYSTYANYLAHCFDPQSFMGFPKKGVAWSGR